MRNILYITANFAPRAASPAIRAVHLVKYLSIVGNKVTVITLTEDALTLFSRSDSSLTAKVPEKTTVIRISPGPLRRKLITRKSQTHVEHMSHVKQNKKILSLTPFLIPGVYADSIYNFVVTGMKQIKKLKPDVIITQAYPFSLHIVGYLLNRITGIDWVADYGDPWSGNPLKELPRPRWRERLDYSLERRLLHRAARISVTTEATRQLYSDLFPECHSKLLLTPMGYDHEDIVQTNPKPREKGDLRVRIVHAGRIYKSARDAKPFLLALARAVGRTPRISDLLEVIFVGDVDEYTREFMDVSELAQVVRYIPWVPAEESVEWMMSSDYLMLFGNKGAMQIPGKVYQYLGVGKPVIFLKQEDGDPTTNIVRETSNSFIVENTVEKIGYVLEEVLELRRQFRSLSLESWQSSLSSKFSWWNIGRELSDELHKL